MFNSSILFLSTYLADDTKSSFPWWLVLLILVILVVIIIWALTRNASSSEADAPHVSHEEEHAAAPVGAAEAVPAQPVPEPVRAPAPAQAATPDDLKIIEGIGPKIASVLQAAGIATFAQLAAADRQTIRDILFKADPRLARISDPTTWPRQARLAADGDMEGLKALQDSLKGGRIV